MSRTLATLTQEVREMLRAEGSDGGGFSDFLVKKAINAGIADLAEIYPIRDTLTFNTVALQNEYDLSDPTLAPNGLMDIIRITYDGKLLRGVSIDDYLTMAAPTEGSINYWVLWGKKLTLTGAVEAKPVQVLITRPAKELVALDDVPETPPMADRAIVQYALASCYQEAREDDAYSVALGNYYRLKNSFGLYSSPRGQRDVQTKVRDSYWGPVRGRGYSRSSDENPHP